jgi:predicted RNA binding protein YcfA (HicA-like mRNA interferase family)
VKVEALVKLLESNGWYFRRHGKGDHDVYKHPRIPETIIIDTSIREIPKGILNKILKQAGLK